MTMHLADRAWKEVDTITIHKCWKKSGILPDTLLNTLSDLVTAASTIPVLSLLNSETEVLDALSHLEQIGILYQSNQMDINNLLNPADEDRMYGHGIEEEIREEIYRAVVEQHDAEER
ncbi:hypothetical protein C0993_005639 [Termitomyces sp. T159_Od127]|nr:hypothetical protein C0993_005639 [Termitomyces sp. T159_Od127]